MVSLNLAFPPWTCFDSFTIEAISCNTEMTEDDGLMDAWVSADYTLQQQACFYVSSGFCGLDAVAFI